MEGVEETEEEVDIVEVIDVDVVLEGDIDVDVVLEGDREALPHALQSKTVPITVVGTLQS